ncbi:MAG: iron-containing alcohol dehydrogenase [Anaerotignum sp.]
MFTDKNEYGYFFPMLMGRGCVANLGEKIKTYGCTKLLVMCDKTLRELGAVDKVINSLDAAGLTYVIWDGVVPDAAMSTINECAAIARNEKINGIVSVGGGSAMDSAKAIDILMGQPGNIEDHTSNTPNNHEKKPGVPMFMIPTTSGTGSEVTPVAVVSDDNHFKFGIWPSLATPRLAVLDPEMTVGMPPSLTAATGMDAFAHAAESFTSGLTNLLSDNLAEQAMRLIIKWLPLAVADGTNLDAREGMQMGQLISGLAFNNSTTTIGHDIAHSLAYFHKVPHGEGCAFAIGETLEYYADVVPERVKAIGELFGLTFAPNATSAEIGKATCAAISEFKRKIKVRKISDRGITEADIKKIGSHYLTDNTGQFFSLKPMTEEAYVQVALAAYHNENA